MNFKTIVMMVCIVGSVHMLTPVPDKDQKALDRKIKSLEGLAQSITIVNGPLILVGLGPFPSIIAGITDIIGTFAGNESIETLAAYDIKELSRCTLMNILIAKAGLFQAVPLIGTPVAGTLDKLKTATDSMFFGKNEAPTEAQRSQLAQFGVCLDAAISAYKGLPI